MKYAIVSAGAVLDLEAEVIKYCQFGWVPHGSLQILDRGPHHAERWQFLQPMVKHEKVSE